MGAHFGGAPGNGPSLPCYKSGPAPIADAMLAYALSHFMASLIRPIEIRSSSNVFE